MSRRSVVYEHALTRRRRRPHRQRDQLAARARDAQHARRRVERDAARRGTHRTSIDHAAVGEIDARHAARAAQRDVHAALIVGDQTPGLVAVRPLDRVRRACRLQSRRPTRGRDPDRAATAYLPSGVTINVPPVIGTGAFAADRTLRLSVGITGGGPRKSSTATFRRPGRHRLGVEHRRRWLEHVGGGCELHRRIRLFRRCGFGRARCAKQRRARPEHHSNDTQERLPRRERRATASAGTPPGRRPARTRVARCCRACRRRTPDRSGRLQRRRAAVVDQRRAVAHADAAKAPATPRRCRRRRVMLFVSLAPL